MNRRPLLSSILVFIVSSPFLASGADEPLVLRDATPVRLRLNRNLSSADATAGDTVDFKVLEDVKIGDVVIIARGAAAIATVTNAQRKRRLGRCGKLDVNIDYVWAVNGDKIDLRAVKQTRAVHARATPETMVLSPLVVWPAAPLYLFIRGRDITIPQGTELTVYTNGEINLNPASFAPKQASKQ